MKTIGKLYMNEEGSRKPDGERVYTKEQVKLAIDNIQYFSDSASQVNFTKDIQFNRNLMAESLSSQGRIANNEGVMFPYQDQPTSKDLNTLKTPGQYFYNSVNSNNTTNKPIARTPFVLTVSTHGQECVQTFITANEVNPKIYTRGTFSGLWQPWLMTVTEKHGTATLAKMADEAYATQRLKAAASSSFESDTVKINYTETARFPTNVENYLNSNYALRVSMDGPSSSTTLEMLIAMDNPERMAYSINKGTWNTNKVKTITTTPALVGGFKAYSAEATPRVRRSGNVVTISGEVSPPASNSIGTSQEVLMFTIPAEYRPPSRVVTIHQGSSQNIWESRVATDGKVYAGRYRTGSVSSNPSTTSWMPFSITYVVED